MGHIIEKRSRYGSTNMKEQATYKATLFASIAQSNFIGVGFALWLGVGAPDSTPLAAPTSHDRDGKRVFRMGAVKIRHVQHVGRVGRHAADRHRDAPLVARIGEADAQCACLAGERAFARN